MGKLSRICCPNCGYNLRRLEKESGKKKQVPYQCPFCHQSWLVTIGNGNPRFRLIFVRVKEEEIINA